MVNFTELNTNITELNSNLHNITQVELLTTNPLALSDCFWHKGYISSTSSTDLPSGLASTYSNGMYFCKQIMTNSAYARKIVFLYSVDANVFYYNVFNETISNWSGWDRFAKSSDITDLKSKTYGTNFSLATSTFGDGFLSEIYAFNNFEYVDLYLSCWNVKLPCIRVYPNFGDSTYNILFSVIPSSDNVVTEFSIRFATSGRVISGTKICKRDCMTTYDSGWVDVSTTAEIQIDRVVGYK